MTLLNKITEVLKTDLNKEISFRKKSEQIAVPTFVENLQKRRSIYVLGKKVHHSQSYLSQLIFEAVRACPSAFNSQSTRVVVLFNQSHLKFWKIAQQEQRQLMPDHIFEGKLLKLEQCAAAFGTILFYEDQQVIQSLQKQRPFNANDFPLWSEQCSGMAQFAAWAALAEAGLGASLQHYNPIVDDAVANHFGIDPQWSLKAQLVFGSIEGDAKVKMGDLEDDVRFKVFD